MSLPDSYHVQDGCWNCSLGLPTVRLADMKFMDAKILCLYPFSRDSAWPNGKCEHWEKKE